MASGMSLDTSPSAAASDIGDSIAVGSPPGCNLDDERDIESAFLNMGDPMNADTVIGDPAVSTGEAYGEAVSAPESEPTLPLATTFNDANAAATVSVATSSIDTALDTNQAPVPPSPHRRWTAGFMQLKRGDLVRLGQW
jgi:hypothetical protein